MFNKEQLQRFSIRKLTVGAASVLIGVSLMTEMNNNKVYADVRTTNENSNSQVHDNSDRNTLNLSTDLKSKADEAGTADSEVTNNSNAKVGGDGVTDNSNARNVEIKNIDDSKKDQQSGDVVAPKEKTANTIQKHEENVAKGTTVDSNDLQVAKAQADLAATKINGKASSVVSPQIKQIQAKYQTSKNLPLEKQINPTYKNSDGKVVVKAEDPSNYPSELNNLIGKDKYIYQVLSLNNDDSRYPDSKLILSVNRNDSNDKNIYAYVIDNNGEIKTTDTVGVDQNKNIDINGRGYRINNDGSSNIIIDGNKESTQNSSTVTSASGYYSWGGYYQYSNLNPIKQGYGLGSTTSNDCSAIGEIIPIYTESSVIKYYYYDDNGDLQEFKDSDLSLHPNVVVTGLTGQEFKIPNVDQYKQVIRGFYLTSKDKDIPTNFTGTLSQFEEGKYYKKAYYNYDTDNVEYYSVYHQISPDGTMEVCVYDDNGYPLTESKEIAPNASTTFGNLTVRNPYVTAAPHEVQFIYKKLGSIIPVDENGNRIGDAIQFKNDPSDPTKALPGIVPSISGYHPKDGNTVVPDPNDLSKDIEVKYVKSSTISVVYHDNTSNKDLSVKKTTGDEDTSFNYNPATDLATLEGKGYVLDEKDNKVPDIPSKFTATDQKVTIHLKHGTVTVTTENPQTPNTPINPDPQSPKYPKDISNTNSDVKRTIDYKFKDGKPAQPTVNVSLHFERTVVIDKVTGDVLSDTWTQSQDFNDVQTPAIQGYTPDRTVVSDKNIGHDHQDIVEHVVYSPDAQHMTITYVDDTTGKTLHTDKPDGVSDQDANYTTSNTIKQYKDQHYKLVSDSTKGQDLIFDHDDKVDQTYEVHFVHGTHTINQTTSPKQTIHYVYADGLARQGKVADDNVQQLSFKRDGYNDEVTGTDHWNDWTPANSQYKAVDSPVIQGYTPDKLVVEKSTVNPTDKDIEITVTYNADKQAAHVIYVDKTTNTTLASDDLSGQSDKDSGYNTQKQIDDYQTKHYVLTSDETNGKNVVFDHNVNDQTYHVYFVHGTHTINQTTSPKQTIHYVYADGLARQGKVADDNVQQLSFKRDGYNDEVTGTDHWNDWTPANSQYKAVDSPVIQGYTPDKLVVEKSTVNPTDKDIEITVTYNADKQAAHVIYVDKTTNTTLASDDLSGQSDKDSGYNTQKQIDDYQTKHYVLTSDETNGKNVVFDHNVNDQTYHVYFVHGTQDVNHQDDVTETVDYKFENGETAQPTVTQTKHFSEGGVKDLVTGKIAWDEAKPQKFDDVTTPAISGYTPDKDKVAGSTVKFGDKDIEVIVTYHNNAQKASVTYIDDKTGKTLKVDNLNGVTNAKSGYTTKAAIDTYTGLGYTLVSDDTNGNEVVFDNDDANDQAFTVHLSHGTITVTPENPGKPGEPINPGKGSANYPDGTDKTGLTDTVNRTITYVMNDGSKAPDEVHDSLSYTASKVIDKVNGEVLETKWSANQDFKDVDSPSVKGYTPDKKTVSNKDVAHDAADITETVKYNADAQKASVTYIDDKTGKTLKVDNLNGVTNAKSGYTTKAAIDTYTGLGYTLVSDDTNGNEVVFDNDDANDQAFTVHLSHGTITVTPENPGKPGEPVNPDNPDGPKYPDGTDEYQVKRTGTQTIHYVGAGDKTPADNKQTFVFTREITFDEVTGKIISVTPWNVQSHTFGNVDTPVIPGYHADKAVAGGATVTPDDLNRVITVTYAPDGNPGDQGDTPTPNPIPDDQPDSEISSDEHFENVKAKDKLDKTNPKKMDVYKKERKIIKTKIAKQDHTEIAEPKLPQTGEADNSIIGLLGMLLASFAAMFGFDSLHSHDKKHKN